MLVLKFGGAATATAEGVRTIVEILRAGGAGAPLVVLSATGRTTRAIDQAARRASAGDGTGAERACAEIVERHRAIANELYPDDARIPVLSAVNREGDRLHALLHGLALVRELSARSHDACLAQGERLATALVAPALAEAGRAVAHVPAHELVVTNAAHGRAEPDSDRVRENVTRLIAPRLAAGQTVVTEGFIGAAPDGSPTTMGWESSDFSATLLGAALGATEVQIWTNVDGIMTVDPRLAPDARTIPALSYDEAEELASLGAKVLHPRTITPLRPRGIPLVVRNVARPANTGTRITGCAAGETGRVKALAVMQHLREADAHATAAGEYLGLHAGSATRRWQAVVPGDGTFAALSVVGEGVGTRAELAATLLAEAGATNVHGLLFGASARSISLIIAAPALAAAVARLHDTLIES